MLPALPDRTEIFRAIDVYLSEAYPQGLPFVARSQMDTLKQWAGPFIKCPVFIPDPSAPDARYSLRLGNSNYPHMKLRIEAAPNESQFLYRADAHDRHICPPAGSREHSEFCKLMEQNQKFVEAIEAAWEKAGLPTFKSYLREDLKQRRGELTT
jgi:hypothetical protein